MRAKFQVLRVEPYLLKDGTQTSEHVVLSPVYKDKDPEGENTKFWNATPAGQIDMYISNPEAFGKLTKGNAFYVDFSPAD